MSELVTYECTQAACGNEWEDVEGGSVCPICGAPGRVKPPAPDDEPKPIRP